MASVTPHEVLRKIRLRRGADLNIEQRRREDPDDPIVALREILDRSTARLSEELYTKKSRFVLEFIQNADDNEYISPGAQPRLEFETTHDPIVIRCNEKGLSEAKSKESTLKSS